jgi:hypothetical protein
MAEQQPLDEAHDWGRMVEESAEAEEARARLPKPFAKVMAAGQFLFALFIICLFGGRILVKVFFPERVGAGLDATSLAILIPIWVMGGVGLLLISVAWIMRWSVSPKKHAEHNAVDGTSDGKSRHR